MQRGSKSWPGCSARLHEVTTANTLQDLQDHHRQLPSPLSTTPPQAQKRKRLPSPDTSPDEQTPSKRLRASPQSHTHVAEHIHDPVAHWVATTFWPETFGEEDLRMSQGNLSSEDSSKRKHSSKQYSERLARLAKNGVHMKASALFQRSSKNLCSSFLTGDRTPSHFPCYPPEKISDVLERVQDLNEARLQRDVTPWVVPSAENLFFSGETIPDYIGEEIQADWIRCAPLGSTRPKPDYTAGLLRTAFTQDEIDKLENYTSLERPFLFTANLCFPFLMCEAKTGREGVNKADQQNIHSASIAVRAIIELYKAAFGTTHPDRVDELHGQVLAFSVSHNDSQVNLYAHYAVLGDDPARTPEFYRYGIAMFSLTMFDGADRYKAYNFVCNVYEKFASEHRKRIKDAVAFLPAVAERTGLSFAASDLALEEMDSQNDGIFQKPGEPASVSQRREMSKLREQMELQREQLNKLLQQLEQQRMDSKQQLEEQKRESKEQLEEQKQKSKEQIEQLKEIISLLKQARM